MHSNKEPRRFAGDLTTEDLARSTPDDPAARTAGGEPDAAGSRPPVHPGESTGGATADRIAEDRATPAGTPARGPADTARTADAAERVDTARPREGVGARDDATTAPDPATGAGVTGIPAGTTGTAGTRIGTTGAAGAAGTTGTAAASGVTGTTGFGGTADTRGTASPADTDDAIPRLLDTDDEQGFRDRWRETQSKFVDDPREAVHSADTLVADVIRTLAATFAEHKQELEGQWSQGEQVDTEELRRALRRYRSFFNRLLSN